MTDTRSDVWEKLNPITYRLECLKVIPLDTDVEDPRVFGKHHRWIQLDQVTDRFCEFIAENRLLVYSGSIHQIEIRVRVVFSMTEPIDRDYIEANLSQLETAILSPLSLLTSFVTGQLGIMPLVMPPFLSRDSEVQDEPSI